MDARPIYVTPYTVADLERAQRDARPMYLTPYRTQGARRKPRCEPLVTISVKGY